jgi:hypothetical protein
VLPAKRMLLSGEGEWVKSTRWRHPAIDIS